MSLLHTGTEAVYETVVLERWEFYTDLHQVQIFLQRTKQRRSVSDCSVLFNSFSVWHASSLSLFQRREVGYSRALARFQQGTPELHLPTPSRSYGRVTSLNKASTHCALSPVHKYMQYAQFVSSCLCLNNLVVITQQLLIVVCYVAWMFDPHHIFWNAEFFSFFSPHLRAGFWL